ncbi:hypothetical protein [Spirillospora sp. CA-128828]|uniref:SbtR family transcriptional regulator n=1 Tax=Spirillospora sp. CA-128828 TaxID=3240033 RepID=UPI003D8F2916
MAFLLTKKPTFPTLKAGKPELREACLRMADLGDRLVARAREAGALRQDAAGADIFALMNAAAWISEHMSKEQADRLVNLTMNGLLAPTIN